MGGCVAQQVGEEFWRRFPFVRLIFGTDGMGMVPQILERLALDAGLRVNLLDFLDHYPEREPAGSGNVGAQAFVNIMQGCDNFCAYCIVPFTRGRQKSRAADAVVAECESLVHRGARELTLLGQNVNSYGQDRISAILNWTIILFCDHYELVGMLSVCAPRLAAESLPVF